MIPSSARLPTGSSRKRFGGRVGEFGSKQSTCGLVRVECVTPNEVSEVFHNTSFL